MSEIYGTFSTAYVEAMRLRLSALEPENKGLSARVAELEVENKTLRDRFSDADTERNAAQAGLKDAFIRAAELEALEKQRAEDEAWGRENVVVTGNASAWIFSRRPETLTYGNSIAAAIRALREKMEAKP